MRRAFLVLAFVSFSSVPAMASELVKLRAPIDDPLFKSTYVGIWKSKADASAATPKWKLGPGMPNSEIVREVAKLSCMVKGGTRVRLLAPGASVSHVRYNRERCEGYVANKFIE